MQIMPVFPAAEPAPAVAAVLVPPAGAEFAALMALLDAVARPGGAAGGGLPDVTPGVADESEGMADEAEVPAPHASGAREGESGVGWDAGLVWPLVTNGAQVAESAEPVLLAVTHGVVAARHPAPLSSVGFPAGSPETRGEAVTEHHAAPVSEQPVRWQRAVPLLSADFPTVGPETDGEVLAVPVTAPVLVSPVQSLKMAPPADADMPRGKVHAATGEERGRALPESIVAIVPVSGAEGGSAPVADPASEAPAEEAQRGDGRAGNPARGRAAVAALAPDKFVAPAEAPNVRPAARVLSGVVPVPAMQVQPGAAPQDAPMPAAVLPSGGSRAVVPQSPLAADLAMVVRNPTGAAAPELPVTPAPTAVRIATPAPPLTTNEAPPHPAPVLIPAPTPAAVVAIVPAPDPDVPLDRLPQDFDSRPRPADAPRRSEAAAAPDPELPVTPGGPPQAQLARGTDEPLPLSTAARSPAPDPAAVAQQARLAVRTLAPGVTEIRLDPPELGVVRFDLLTRAGAATLHVSAEQPQTLELLRGGLHGLMGELRSLGFERVEITLAGSPRAEADGGAAGRQPGGGPPGHAPPDSPSAGELPDSAGGAVAAAPSGPRLRPGAGLDLRL